MPSRPLPPSPNPIPANSTRIRVRILILALTISFSSLFFLALLFFLLYLYFSLLDRSPTLPFDSAAPLRLQRYSYRDLRSATNGFDSAHSLGRGGSGSVFRAVLRDGKSVAVKRMDPGSSSPSDREFQNELQILGLLSSPYVVSLLGYCVEKKKRLLVYEYMPSRSLQEALFSPSDSETPDLDWDQRFKIILDIAHAISFLHLECDPPVIHGDIKPSNVLLGADFRAKLSDFGLSRIKNEGGDVGIEFFSQDLGRSQELWKSQELASGTLNPPESPPVDFSLALRPSSLSKKSFTCASVTAEDVKANNGSPSKGKETLVLVATDDELSSVDFSKELNGHSSSPSPIEDPRTNTNHLGSDWWWRQDGSGELSSKDYVREWIGSQICPARNPDWDDEKKSSPRKSDFENSDRAEKGKDADHLDAQMGKFEKKEVLNGCDKKHKKMKEWWKEEYFAEMSKKSKSNNKGFNKWLKTSGNQGNGETSGDYENYTKEGNMNMDISFRKGWKKKKRSHSHSVGSEMWSGDMFSRELSSTTSMRGTVCYVAPEYGGCGFLMEKADIYSLGVLILVVVSGRRPLHVLSSPMKLEKANLISWSRHLAQTGSVLELVDERLKDLYNKDQATLCINLALLCLQRIPELRPDSGEIVKILKGEMDLPPLPVEFSPSPPSKLFSRTRRKPTLEADQVV